MSNTTFKPYCLIFIILRLLSLQSYGILFIKTLLKGPLLCYSMLKLPKNFKF